MKISNASHLTYCLNIHRGETWAEHSQAIKDFAVPVRDQLGITEPFGLGLRMGVDAAEELKNPQILNDFKEVLSTHNLYPFTVNAFPYGRFHGTRVKENVYAPDWQTDERVTYTKNCIDALSDLLPEGVQGSISTVPCSFKPWITKQEQAAHMACNIADIAAHLFKTEERYGTYIHLGLEPEPSCYLETTSEFIAFYNDHLLIHGRDHLVNRYSLSPAHAEEMLRKYIGINFDCCHLAIQFEDLSQSLLRYTTEGILLSKIHLSAALRIQHSDDISLLEPFDEPVYLHQVKARTGDGEIFGWDDLPEAFEALPYTPDFQEARIHFHVPLFWEGSDQLGTTAAQLNGDFWKKLNQGVSPHLEIETYTFDVLPDELRSTSVVDSIAQEYQWVFNKLQRYT